MLHAVLLAATFAGQIGSIPNEAQLRKTNGLIVSFTSETLRDRTPIGEPKNWPQTLNQPDTYWKDERPIMDWPADVRRYVLDRFTDQAKDDPKVRSWLLSTDAMTNTTLRLSLQVQVELHTKNVQASKCFSPVGVGAMPFDQRPLGQLVASFTDRQKDMIERNYMRIDYAKLTGEQRDLVKKLDIPMTGETTADRDCQVVFDFYYQAYIYHGKDDRFYTGLARSTDFNPEK